MANIRVFLTRKLSVMCCEHINTTRSLTTAYDSSRRLTTAYDSFRLHTKSKINSLRPLFCVALTCVALTLRAMFDRYKEIDKVANDDECDYDNDDGTAYRVSRLISVTI